MFLSLDLSHSGMLHSFNNTTALAPGRDGDDARARLARFAARR